MCVVPALEAGVRRIVVCTPPSGAGLIAAAAALLGVDEVWALGGPQAIGWLAYVERVDKIVGPGNAYVNEAKLEVSRDVPIDLPGGPSEVIVLGGANGDARLVELELAAQREHGHEAVCRAVDTLEEAEAIAPEHLVLLGDAEAYADRVRNAGSVFVGRWSPVPAGDYATGGNHVLPTNGWARSVGGLGLETFLKPVTVQRLTEAGLARIRPTVEALAAVEGMPAHAEAVRR
jgi:histidinol dehydrogenase